MLPSCIGSWEASFCESIKSLHRCCAQARDAACAGRYSAAHGLFQNALVFFERARAVTWDDEDELYFWQRAWQMSRARRELDDCAELVYTESVELELASKISQSVTPPDEANRVELRRLLVPTADSALEINALRPLERRRIKGESRKTTSLERVLLGG